MQKVEFFTVCVYAEEKRAGGEFMFKRLTAALLALALLLMLAGCGKAFRAQLPEARVTNTAETVIDEDGSYNGRDEVALYIHTYGRLPENYITKKQAQTLGWSGGSLEPYAPGKCIGGDRFGNYEGLLPKKSGRSYIECDIDTLGASSRGAKRIVFSNDGLIYYTADHYQSFELLYGEG